MNWRKYGKVPYETWRIVIDQAGGPEELSSRAAWEAGGEHSALALAMLNAESSYGTNFNLNPASSKNPLNLRPPSGGGYMRYSSWVEGVKAWHDRITSKTYKNGIYANTTTIEDLIAVYAPSSDSNNEQQYVSTIKTLFLRWKISGTDTTSPVPVTTGRVPRPAIRDDLVIKPEGMGWADYGPRILRAVALHRVVGAARWTSGHFRNLNDPHGRNALTDWGVCGVLDGDLDGVILKWNDPDSNRSPWANGPASKNGQLVITGDAIPFYDRYGRNQSIRTNVFNRDVEAIEFSGYYDTPISSKQMDSAVHLIAYRMDTKAKVSYRTWPKNNDGVQAILWHGEVNGWDKPCPGEVVIAQTDEVIEGVHAVLLNYQSQGEPVPPPPTTPRNTGPLPGISWEAAPGLFNPLGILDPDTTRRVLFTRGGPAENEWVAHLQETKMVPPLVFVQRLGAGGSRGKRYQFGDGFWVDVERV